MIEKRFIITGLVEVGPYIRVILYPDEAVRKKKTFDLMGMTLSGDVSAMQEDGIINGILSGKPPTIYLTVDEIKQGNIKLDDHIIVSLEVE